MKEYICKEDLLQAFEENLKYQEDKGYWQVAKCTKLTINKIGYFPVADVAPVVHGKWIGKIPEDEAFAEGVPDDASEDFKKAYRDMMDHITHCSNCSGAQDDRDVIHYSYCPYCGTKMDLEDLK